MSKRSTTAVFLGILCLLVLGPAATLALVFLPALPLFLPAFLWAQQALPGEPVGMVALVAATVTLPFYICGLIALAIFYRRRLANTRRARSRRAARTAEREAARTSGHAGYTPRPPRDSPDTLRRRGHAASTGATTTRDRASRAADAVSAGYMIYNFPGISLVLEMVDALRSRRRRRGR